MPMSSGGLSIGTSAMLGRPQGGFNPTQSEYLNNRIQNASMARYMADIYRGDPRTAAFTNMLLQAMYGNESKRRQATVEKLGGLGNLQEMVGFAISQPGISGYMGGPAALGIGSYAAAAGGIGINSRLMQGDGPMVQQMAKMIYGEIMKKFYTPGGASIMGATQGLSRDQLGGLLTVAGSQGAFRGVNAGILKMGNDGNPQLTVDTKGMQQMHDTISNLAKAAASLQDVFGPQTAGKLATLMQQITGLSMTSPENVKAIASNITSLRNTGILFGVGAQDMFERSAQSVMMAQSLGLGGNEAANVGKNAAEWGTARATMLNIGRSTARGGRMMEWNDARDIYVRDRAGMRWDPIGARMNLVSMLMDQGQFKDEKIRNEISTMMAGAGPGGMNEHDIDRFFHQERFGRLNIPGIMRAMGGPGKIADMMSYEQSERAGQWTAGSTITGGKSTGMEARGWLVARRSIFKPMFGSAAGAAELLTKTFDNGLMQNLFSGDAAQQSEALRQSSEARRDPNKFTQAIKDVIAGSGGNASAALGKLNTANLAMQSGEFTKGLATSTQQEAIAQQTLARVPLISKDDRGFTQLTAMEGILQRYGNTDPRSQFAMMMHFHPELVAGGTGNIILPKSGEALDVDKARRLQTALETGLRTTEEGREVLSKISGLGPRAFWEMLRDPTQQLDLFRKFTRVNLETKNGTSTAFAVTSLMNHHYEEALAIEATLKAGAITGARANWLEMSGRVLADPLYRYVKDGKVLGRDTADQAKKRADASLIEITSIDALQRFGTANIAALAKSNGLYGHQVMAVLDKLDDDKKFNMEDFDDAERLNFIKDTKEALGKAGVSSTLGSEPDSTKVTGTVSLSPETLNTLAQLIDAQKK